MAAIGEDGRPVIAPPGLRRLLVDAKINREVALIAAIERAAGAIADLTKAIDMAQPGSLKIKYYCRDPHIGPGGRLDPFLAREQGLAKPDLDVVSPPNVTLEEGL